MIGALKYALSGHQDMHAFEIKSQAHQTPVACDFYQTTQRKLAKAHDLLDNTDDRFNAAFPGTARQGSVRKR
jgi:hypothetical protein